MALNKGIRTMSEETADLEYQRDEMFTIFYPTSDAGLVAWNQMREQEGGATVMTAHEIAVINQLRAAGYIVRKSKPIDTSDDELLEQLGVLS